MDAPYPFSQPGIVPRAGRIYQGEASAGAALGTRGTRSEILDFSPPAR